MFSTHHHTLLGIVIPFARKCHFGFFHYLIRKVEIAHLLVLFRGGDAFRLLILGTLWRKSVLEYIVFFIVRTFFLQSTKNFLFLRTLNFKNYVMFILFPFSPTFHSFPTVTS